MRLQNIRSGNYPVITANHTLILNWNSQTVPLLRQIAINKLERSADTYDGYAFLPTASCCFSGTSLRTACACLAAPAAVWRALT